MATIQTRRTDDGELHYRVLVRKKGFPQQTATFERLTDARKWAKQTESAIDEGRHFKTREAKRHTLGEAIERYKAEILPRKPKSAPKQSAQLDWWTERIGRYALADVTPALIVEQRSALTRDGIGAGTANRYMAALSHLFTMCVREWGWLDDTPMRKVQRLKEPRGRVRFLSDDERRALLESCKESTNPHLYDAVVLALSTGCRKNEIIHLRWRDVDFERGVIVLHDTKNNERRAVPITGHAFERLQDRAHIRRIDTDYVFAQDAQVKPADIDRDFARARDAAKIQDFRFHDLRHSAASYLAMNGATLAEIAEVLGHKTLAMVKRYAHLSQAHTSAVVSRMTAKLFAEGKGA